MFKKYLRINDVSDFITPDTCVSCFDCSPNGLTIACVHENIIQIYDIQSGNQVGSDMIGDAEEIEDIRYSVNGDLLFSGGDDHNIYIWDLTTYSQNGLPLSGHTNTINSLAISPNGTHLASASHKDNTIRIWGLQDRVCLSIIPVLLASSLQYSNSGNLLRCISQNQIIRIDTKSMIRCKVYSLNQIERLEVYDNLLVSASVKQAHIQDKQTGKYIRKLIEADDDIYGITISSKKKFVAIIGEAMMHVCDIQSGKRYGPFLDDNDHLFYDVKFSKDGQHILTSHYSGVLKSNLSAILKA